VTELLADAHAARRALDAGEVGVVDLTRAALERAEALQPRIGAFAELTPELALDQAAAAEDELRAVGPRSRLHGLPLAVKDVIDVAGVPTRMGSPRAGHHTPDRNAPVVDALRAAGAIVIGKSATHELAYGMITPQARNPRDPERITGGSSGGSAAAVAAGIAPLALGTDTNGSIRCPAAHCGVVGLKPTRGAITRDGVAQLAWTQDTVGLMAADVATVAAAWDVLKPPSRRPSRAHAREEVAGRVGVDRQACAAADPAVGGAVEQALARMPGIEFVDVRAPDLALAVAASVLAIVVEASAAWAAGGDGVSPPIRAALLAGTEVPRDAYLDAKRVRASLCAHMRELFESSRIDALALPTVPVTASPAGAERVLFRGRERAVESLQPTYTALASLTGQPAISVPCGSDADGLPVGLQLLGRAHEEDALLELASQAPFV
jgi:aspartyl-tRNA(Asn)/glutamyl-tRNA(Gln) amidotransferase subunit A